MTLDEKIGQMLLFGWQTNEQRDALTDELNVGGVILMGRNAEPPEKLKQTLDALQTRAKAHNLPPLFVAIDQEGGRVQRLMPPDYAKIPAAQEWTDARTQAKAVGEELASVGINWDFAPVLDVNNNPNNPVIGARSFSDDPQIVAEMGVEAMRGFQTDAGMLACGKHFPGHGDTDTDSHHALPRISHGRERLDTVELVPFRAAIDAGLAAIMTSHIIFPALDAELPATLSPTILTGLLREELGFDGLIITDDLEMRGVADGWGASEAAILSVLAGADILLCCHKQETQRAIFDALANAVKNGRLSETRIDDANRRIASAKARWIRTSPPVPLPSREGVSVSVGSAALSA